MRNELGQIRSVTRGDVTIAYHVAGPEDAGAPRICMIPSTGRGPGDFAEIARFLAKRGFRVLMPWPRGTGPSTGMLDFVDFHDFAADAAAVLEVERGQGKAIIAGHAFGCWIARTLAQDRPDLVDGIVLLAAAAGSWAPELSQAINIAMAEEAREEDRIAALRLAFFTGAHDPRPWLRGWFAHLATAQRAAKPRSARATWWPSGTAPILDVVGLQDPFRPAALRDFYAREFAPRVTLVTVDGASHALPDEKPEEVAAIVAQWVAGLSGRV